MQRLVLAVLIVLVILAFAAVALRSLATAGSENISDETNYMDKLAYGLLLALIVYVSVTGGA